MGRGGWIGVDGLGMVGLLHGFMLLYGVSGPEGPLVDIAALPVVFVARRTTGVPCGSAGAFGGHCRRRRAACVVCLIIVFRVDIVT